MYRRILFAAAVVLLGAAAMLASPGPASASANPNRAATPTVSVMATSNNVAIAVDTMRSCASEFCTIMDRSVVGQTYKDFCYRDDVTFAGTARWDLVSAGSTGTGFLRQSALFNKSQNTPCANGGDPAFVRSGQVAVPRVCPNINCRTVGGEFLPSDGVLRQYCRQPGGTFEFSNIWYLVFNPTTGVAGYVPESRIGGLLNSTTCTV